MKTETKPGKIVFDAESGRVIGMLWDIGPLEVRAIWFDREGADVWVTIALTDNDAQKWIGKRQMEFEEREYRK